jgi:hypothetical protein
MVCKVLSRWECCIRVNDDNGHYFQTLGDSLSPMLFNVVVDILATLIAQAKAGGQVGSLIPHLVECGVYIL